MTDKERIQFLEAALIACFDAAIPQAMPWTNTPSEKADYTAKTLPQELRGLNRLLSYKSERLAALEAEVERLREEIKERAEVFRETIKDLRGEIKERDELRGRLLSEEILNEREQCARIADAPACVNFGWERLLPMEFGSKIAESIATQIRARSTKGGVAWTCDNCGLTFASYSDWEGHHNEIHSRLSKRGQRGA